MQSTREVLDNLAASGNLRRIPDDLAAGVMDFSTNDYMGLTTADVRGSTAARLLAPIQAPYKALEDRLEELYGRPALTFNSGYHANTGLVPVLAPKGTLILADKLVHASIIDGITLSKAPFQRFRHNDFEHLEQLIAKYSNDYERILVLAESVYSMDGDRADIARLVDIRRRNPKVILYVDEAHAFGVLGDKGLGLCAPFGDEVDMVIGTFGKAASSMGAFCVCNAELKQLAINQARSFIFSTALPPAVLEWTLESVNRLVEMDAERAHLQELAKALHEVLQPLQQQSIEVSHIQPLIVGDATRAVELSQKLKALGFNAMAIRRPTVPPGTERLRFSLSAAMSLADIQQLKLALHQLL
ncbi:MAG: 8-amino-7-oxononanoate synthase [Bacteroidales bacterium]|nr:8-amino-7-oxononanoate synthase [Bacteroidales bacterium]MCD8395366.1 8-amino-7-oxononanoate synthase [Bacteroidales bacterium]